MTKPYLFIRFETGQEMHSPVSLDAEPTIGQCVWIAGTRYKILSISGDEITIAKTEKGYREPRNAIGTLSIMREVD